MNESATKEANSWATAHGINKAFEKIFNLEVHIIHPHMSSIHSPRTDESGVINYV